MAGLTVGQIYRVAILEGMRADPQFAGSQVVYREGVYPDSKLIHGDIKKKVRRVLAGINIGSSEVMLAEKLGVDLVVSHHTLGAAYNAKPETAQMLKPFFIRFGVDPEVTQVLMDGVIKEKKLELLGQRPTHEEAVDMARLLNVPLMCLHTCADNITGQILQKKLESQTPCTLEKLVEELLTMPEYQLASRRGLMPMIVVGEKKLGVERLVVDMTGAYAPPVAMYAEMKKVGVDTVILMSVKSSDLNELKQVGMNVVVAGHAASDSVGMNYLLDMWEKEGAEIIKCGGLLRYERQGKKN